jgi:hypothetical protein
VGIRVQSTINRTNRLSKEQLECNLARLQDIPIGSFCVDRASTGRQILRVRRDKGRVGTGGAGTDLGKDVRVIGIDPLENEGSVVGLVGVTFLVRGGWG